MSTTPPNQNPADNRLEQITVGAGLQESRYNQEFVDFLKKYGFLVLLVIAAISFAWFGLQKLRERREGETNLAFSQLEESLRTGSPTALARLADEHDGQGAVPHVARLAAADALMVNAFRGLVPGATLNPDGTVKNPDELLTAEGRTRQLEEARVLYQRVVDDTKGDRFKAIHTIGGLFGLAAIAESLGKFEDAASLLKDAQARAAAADLKALADEAQRRLDTQAEAKVTPRLLSDKDVATYTKPTPPPTPVPPLPAGPDFPPTPLLPEQP
jgi:hypothetical protein